MDTKINVAESVTVSAKSFGEEVAKPSVKRFSLADNSTWAPPALVDFTVPVQVNAFTSKSTGKPGFGADLGIGRLLVWPKGAPQGVGGAGTLVVRVRPGTDLVERPELGEGIVGFSAPVEFGSFTPVQQ